MSAAQSAPASQTAHRPRTPAANGCIGHTDQRGDWRACEAGARGIVADGDDRCRLCAILQRRADEAQAAAATLAPTPVETPQRGEKAGTVFACIGWDDADARHHACETPAQPHLAKGRCRRCYHRQAGANAASREANPPPPPPAPPPAPVPPPPQPRPPAPAPAPARGEWQPEPVEAVEAVAPDRFPGEDAAPAPPAAPWRSPHIRLSDAVPPAPPQPEPPEPPDPLDLIVWDPYTAPPNRRGTSPGPTLTIAASHRLTLNRAAFEALGSPDRVTLWLGTAGADRYIAVRAGTPEQAHALPVRTRDQGSNRRCDVAARGFLLAHAIPHAATARYPATPHRGALIVALPTPEPDPAPPCPEGSR